MRWPMVPGMWEKQFSFKTLCLNIGNSVNLNIFVAIDIGQNKMSLDRIPLEASLVSASVLGNATLFFSFSL